jgi:aminomethyltransferase
MSQKTPLHPLHQAAHARLVDFHGWEMPLHYGSQIQEHLRVREDCGLFDVSHMSRIRLRGPESRDFLRWLLANDVARLDGRPGKALYSLMLNSSAGIIDDLIVYGLGADDWMLVMNAATRNSDMLWIRQQAEAFSVEIIEYFDAAMLALQGPRAFEQLARIRPEWAAQASDLPPFASVELPEGMLATTGYTGEAGCELMLGAGAACAFWADAMAAGVQPVGLAARDTLRLEAGMLLYGLDMDDTTSPLASGLDWTLAMKDDRIFIGRDVLEQQKAAGNLPRFVGLVLDEGRAVMRTGCQVLSSERIVGEVTSGVFSPSLQKPVAFARISASADASLQVVIRNRQFVVRQVPLPFVRKGQVLV